MKKHLIFGIAMFFLMQSIVIGQQEKIDEKWYLIEDFETCYNWKVYNTEFSKKEWFYLNPVFSIINGAPAKLKKAGDNSYADLQSYYYLRPGKYDHCLGIKVRMDHFGDTEKFIIPIYKIKIPGICKKISFWINSRNVKITLKVKFENYQNYLYTLEPEPFALDFWGWREFVITDIDKKIPQVPETSVDYKPLQIIGFVLDNPFKKVFKKPIYLYMDQLKAYCTIKAIPDYDGKEILDKW